MRMIAERLRNREAALALDLSRTTSPPGASSSCVLAQTTTLSSYPTLPQSFYACVPVALLGSEVEGGPATFAPGPEVFYALNVGSAVPLSGSLVLAVFVGNRWIFRYDG